MGYPLGGLIGRRLSMPRGLLNWSVGLAMILAACGPSTTPTGALPTGTAAGEPRQGGKIVYSYWQSGIGVALNMLTVGPAGGKNQMSGFIYEGLYRTTHEGIEDWLATKTQISDDGRMWTLTLREGVKFHDGTALDATAIKKNLDIRLGHATFALKPLLKPIQEVKVVDHRTVQLLLAQPFAPLRSILAGPQMGMQSPTAMAKYPEEDYWRYAAGTGPFKLEGTPSDTSVRLVRNPDYWGPVFLDEIEVRTISDEAVALAALEAADIDVARLSPAEVGRVRREGRLNVGVEADTNSPWMIGFNLRKPLTGDLRVRQAIVYGTNRPSYPQVAPGSAALGYSMVSPSSFGYEKQSLLPYDVEKAKQLAAEGGVKPGTPLEFVVIDIGEAHSKLGAQLIAEDLGKLGFKVNIRVLEAQAYRAALTGQNVSSWDLFYQPLGAQYPDAEAIFFRFFEGSAAQNWSGYKNPKFDELLQKQRAVTDAAARASSLAELQRILMADMPMYPTYGATLPWGLNKALRDVQYTENGTPLVGKAWLAR